MKIPSEWAKSMGGKEEKVRRKRWLKKSLLKSFTILAPNIVHFRPGSKQLALSVSKWLRYLNLSTQHLPIRVTWKQELGVGLYESSLHASDRKQREREADALHIGKQHKWRNEGICGSFKRQDLLQQNTSFLALTSVGGEGCSHHLLDTALCFLVRSNKRFMWYLKIGAVSPESMGHNRVKAETSN